MLGGHTYSISGAHDLHQKMPMFKTYFDRPINLSLVFCKRSENERAGTKYAYETIYSLMFHGLLNPGTIGKEINLLTGLDFLCRLGNSEAAKFPPMSYQ
jgi:hypothetical protein